MEEERQLTLSLTKCCKLQLIYLQNSQTKDTQDTLSASAFLLKNHSIHMHALLSLYFLFLL